MDTEDELYRKLRRSSVNELRRALSTPGVEHTSRKDENGLFVNLSDDEEKILRYHGWTLTDIYIHLDT